MDKNEILDKLKFIIEDNLIKFSNDKKVNNTYKLMNESFLEDIEKLKEIFLEEFSRCKKGITEKKLILRNIEEKEYLDTDNDGHSIFVILPIFNATDEQAEKCIYSILDNYEGLDFKMLIISNRILEVFNVLKENKISAFIYLKEKFSLPEAYNMMVKYAKKYAIDKNVVISLMDDDAFLITGQNQKVREAYCKVKNDEYVAVSGHYYDLYPCKTSFEKIVNQTHIYDFVSKYRKPYCHGGASFMIKLDNFPYNGLPITGLGGISVNIMAIEKSNLKNWYLYNNVDFMVYHPRKSNLFAWMTTYLSYEIAWKRAFEKLSDSNRKIWEKQIEDTSNNRINGLLEGLKDPAKRIYCLGNIFLSRYIKTNLLNNFNYEDFKKYNVATHINLSN